MSLFGKSQDYFRLCLEIVRPPPVAAFTFHKMHECQKGRSFSEIQQTENCFGAENLEGYSIYRKSKNTIGKIFG